MVSLLKAIRSTNSIYIVIFLLFSMLLISCGSNSSPPPKDFLELDTELPNINTGGYTTFDGPKVKEYEVGFSNFSPKWYKSKDYDNSWKLDLTTEDNNKMVLYFQEVIHDQNNNKIAVLFRIDADGETVTSNKGLEVIVHNTIWPVVASKRK